MRGHRKIPMKFPPLHDRVVIRRAEGDLKSKGGIIIPGTAKERPQEGEVIAVARRLGDHAWTDQPRGIQGCAAALAASAVEVRHP